jgi:hypothetical protein
MSSATKKLGDRKDISHWMGRDVIVGSDSVGVATTSVGVATTSLGVHEDVRMITNML